MKLGFYYCNSLEQIRCAISLLHKKSPGDELRASSLETLELWRTFPGQVSKIGPARLKTVGHSQPDLGWLDFNLGFFP